MKSVYFLFAIIIMSTIPAWAQVAIGVRGGAGITGFSGIYQRESFDIQGREFVSDADYKYTISNQNAGLQGSIFGFQGGLAFRIFLGESMDFIPEVNYQVTGTNLSYIVQTQAPNLSNPANRLAPLDTLLAEDRVNLSYIHVPLPVRLNFNFGLNLQVGPYVSFLLSQAQTSTIQNIQAGTSEEITYQSENFNVEKERSQGTEFVSLYARTDFGFVVGVGYDLPYNLSVDLRYQRSFINIINDNIAETNRFESNHKIHALTLGVTYYFINPFK